MENFFSDRELQCKCCGALVIDAIFLHVLNDARNIYGHEFVINSGYRCQKHNKEVGSKSQNHVRGKAADIQCSTSLERYVMVRALQLAGMRGIGIGQNFIHADFNHESQALWTY